MMHERKFYGTRLTWTVVSNDLAHGGTQFSEWQGWDVFSELERAEVKEVDMSLPRSNLRRRWKKIEERMKTLYQEVYIYPE